MARGLKIYTSLWAMRPHDASGVMLGYEEVCEKVAGAGYAGMALDLGAGGCRRSTAGCTDYAEIWADASHRCLSEKALMRWKIP